MKFSTLAVAALMSLSAVTANAKAKHEKHTVLVPTWACTLGKSTLAGGSIGIGVGVAGYRTDNAKMVCVSSLLQATKIVPVTVTIVEAGYRTGVALTPMLFMSSFNLGIEDIDAVYNEYSFEQSTGGTFIAVGGRASGGVSIAGQPGDYDGGAFKVTLAAGLSFGLEWNQLSGSIMVIENQKAPWEPSAVSTWNQLD